MAHGNPKRYNASQSFTHEEVTCLDEILTKLLRGGDVKMLVRSRAFPGLMRKAQTMVASIERQRAGVQLPKGHRGLQAAPQGTETGSDGPSDESVGDDS